MAWWCGVVTCIRSPIREYDKRKNFLSAPAALGVTSCLAVQVSVPLLLPLPFSCVQSSLSLDAGAESAWWPR